MALITERPRSASVRAAEELEVGVIESGDFSGMWRTDPDAVRSLVRVLCERIRTLNALVTNLAQYAPHDDQARRCLGADLESIVRPPTPIPDDDVVVIEGLTPIAEECLEHCRIVVRDFPYEIGRKTGAGDADPFSRNDLRIDDPEGYHVSRNHCAILR